MSESQNETACGKILVGVAIAIISAAIIAIFPLVRQFISLVAISIWTFLLSIVRIPWFIILILSTLSFITLWRWIRPLFNKNKGEKEPLPSEYTEDIFFDVVWKWDYLDNEGLPDHSLWCFCPQCGTRLIYRVDQKHLQGSFGEIEKVTIFHCELCGEDKTYLQGNKDFALSSVARQVERRYNNGDWKEVVYKKRQELTKEKAD